MHGNALQAYLDTKGVLCGAAKSKIVNGVTAVKESSVNVKKIGVGSVPAETGADECLLAGKRGWPHRV
jgi:hypothetical protein